MLSHYIFPIASISGPYPDPVKRGKQDALTEVHTVPTQRASATMGEMICSPLLLMVKSEITKLTSVHGNHAAQEPVVDLLSKPHATSTSL